MAVIKNIQDTSGVKKNGQVYPQLGVGPQEKPSQETTSENKPEK